MAASDPDQHSNPPVVPPGVPQAQPLPQGQAIPQGQAYPRAQPLPQARPVVGPQPVAPQPLAQGPPYAPGQPSPLLPQGDPVRLGTQPASPARPGAARPILVEGQAAEKVIDAHDGEEEEEDLTAFAVRSAPAWLLSAAFHMLMLIILALLLMPRILTGQIDLETVWAEKLGDQLELDTFLAGNDPEDIEAPVITLEDLPPVDDPFAAPADVDVVLDNLTASSKVEASVGIALMGREEGMKQALLDAYGGNASTEAAVSRGLDWLARVQRKDGSWSLIGIEDEDEDAKKPPKLKYTNGASDENRPAATAMALLAFQGAGNTHKRGKFKKDVARAWDWLLEQQDRDGNFFHKGPFNHRFYTQGQCTIALCELYGMTKDYRFRDPAERAVRYCLQAQGSGGGWRYSPGNDSDVSVTGWVVMALQSARMAGIEVPEDHFTRVGRFLDGVGKQGGTRYPYQRGRETTRAMTAEAMLCRQYLGWPHDDQRLLDAVTWITQPENLISYEGEPNVYYWYYATQVAHHMGDPFWKRWNDVMRQKVPEHQVKSGGEAGSWDPGRPDPSAPGGYQWQDQFASYGGRLYVTCLSIYMLEVYYRHMPLYSNVYTFMRMR